MHPPDVTRAVAAATSLATDIGLDVDDAVVLQDSNTLTLRLLPGDVLARVAHRGQEVARFEVELARRLAATGAPVAALDPRVEPRPYEADGFVVTLWTFYEAVGPAPAPAVVADALVRLHRSMRTVDLATPHFTDRVASAQALVTDPALTPALADADRTLLTDALRRTSGAIAGSGAPEQLLHGEPHPGNVLATTDGLRFIDLETCCRGPVEYDLAHVSDAVGRCYPDVDRELLDECRALVLAMVAAWRWDAADHFPDGRRAGLDLLAALRGGPPWPTLVEVMPPQGDPPAV